LIDSADCFTSTASPPDPPWEARNYARAEGVQCTDPAEQCSGDGLRSETSTRCRVNRSPFFRNRVLAPFRPSTAPSCTPSLRASTSISADGQCRSSNDYEDVPTGHGAGWMRHGCDGRSSSPIGISSPHRHAGLWEPYDGRPSRTVLREREGEVPSRYSPGLAPRQR
jgi:hypothetical protein